ncbi:urease accessory protein [Ignatzschineria ureiclastica]|uniref:Urease accessory protein UreD n=2 Tax=Ignatzschineria ureiclastica TaxID=472582 RepID=A0A2U2AEE6_9GAMM|nr:urease accessory protein [Ignatzschineria ureiclastica]
MQPYQSEPPQMPSGSVGKSGYLKLRFAEGAYRSELVEMERRVPSLAQKALYWDELMPQLPCVTMISTSGGLLQGDRQALDIIVEEDACGHVTTQSATKIHLMDANYATQYQRIVVKAGGYLEYLPDPIIPHRHARFITDTAILIDPTATMIYSEILMSGRKHHHPDEQFGFDIFSSTIRASRMNTGMTEENGMVDHDENHYQNSDQYQSQNQEQSHLTGSADELFVEKYILEPHKSSLTEVAVMGGFEIFGNVILLTPKEHHADILARIEAHYDADEKLAYGATLLPNDAGIIFKVLGNDSTDVKMVIRDFWRIAREEILGISVPEPFLWR